MCSTAVTTQANGNGRPGTYLCEPTLLNALAAGTLNSETFGRLSSLDLDGALYAQPLYLPKASFDGQRDVVILATMANTVLLIDVTNAHLPTQIWSKNVGPPLPVQQLFSQ
jgi:hypothetical protein